VQQRLGGNAQYVKIMERHRPVVKPLRDQLVGNAAAPLWILLGTVAIVFLIACVNVANLFTVRAENRRADLVVRRALGAARGDLVRVQVTEAFLLAAVSGAIGVLIAWVGVPGLVRAAPEAVASGFSGAPIPGLATAHLDGTTVLFAAGISILAACAFGLIPAFRVSGSRLGSLQQCAAETLPPPGLVHPEMGDHAAAAPRVAREGPDHFSGVVPQATAEQPAVEVSGCASVEFMDALHEERLEGGDFMVLTELDGCFHAPGDRAEAANLSGFAPRGKRSG